MPAKAKVSQRQQLQGADTTPRGGKARGINSKAYKHGQGSLWEMGLVWPALLSLSWEDPNPYGASDGADVWEGTLWRWFNTVRKTANWIKLLSQEGTAAAGCCWHEKAKNTQWTWRVSVSSPLSGLPVSSGAPYWQNLPWLQHREPQHHKIKCGKLDLELRGSRFLYGTGSVVC